MYLRETRPNDWESIRVNFQRLGSAIFGSGASPVFAGLTLSGLTASALIGADADKALESVTIGTGLDYTRPTLSLSHLGIEDLTDPGGDRILFWDDSETASGWLAVGNSIVITTTTVDTVQDIRTTAVPQFTGLGLGEAGAAGQIQITSAVNQIQRVDIENTSDGNAARAGFTARSDVVSFTADAYSSNHATNPKAVTFRADTDGDFRIQNFGIGASLGTITIKSGAELVFTPVGGSGYVSFTGTHVALTNFAELRFYDDGANYVGFEAPALTANKIWVLPNADGTAGQHLKTDGAGNLGWGQAVLTTSSPTFAGLSLGTGELTCGSINRAADTLTIEIGGVAQISVTNTGVTFAGGVTITGTTTYLSDIILPDGGWIGSDTTNQAIQIEDDGDVVMTGMLAVTGDIQVTGNILLMTDRGGVGYSDNNPMIVFDDTNNRVEFVGNIMLADDGTIGVADGTPSILFDNTDGQVEVTGTLTVSVDASITGTITASNYTAANLLTACATSAGGLDFSGAYTLTVGETATTTSYHTDARAATWLAANHETTYNHTNYNTAYNNSVTAIAFNTADGIITITQQDTGTLTTVSLDGRYYTEAEIAAGYQPLDAGLTSLAGLVYASDSFIKVTATDTYAIRTIAETKTDLSLNLVENTAISIWVGSTNITTVGTIATGTWEATDVGIAHGGTGQSTQQAAIDALTNVSAATNEHVLTKDTATGNAIFKAAAGSSHAILDGSTHSDSVADAVTRGSIIYGNSTPKWDELVLGTNTKFLMSDGTDLAYKDIDDLTADASPVGSTDYVMTYDATAGTHKKVLLDNFHRVVDRGDPAAYDFTTPGDFADEPYNSWYDLDLSGTVPAGATWVKLRVIFKHATVGAYIQFRENGNSNTYNTLQGTAGVANVYCDINGDVRLDSSRVIEYRLHSAATQVSVVIRGWVMG